MSLPPGVHQRVQQWFEINTLPETPKAEVIWIDIETTGLDEENDKLLEVGCIITDRYGFPVDYYDELISYHYQPGVTRAAASTFVQLMHDKSGLWAELDAAKIQSSNLTEAKGSLWTFLDRHTSGKVPMAGSSVDFDRRWLTVWMPSLVSEFFTHRVIDVSSTQEQLKMHHPALLEYHTHQPMGAHRVLPDLIDTIELYRFQISEFFWTPENAAGLNSPSIPKLGPPVPQAPSFSFVKGK